MLLPQGKRYARTCVESHPPSILQQRRRVAWRRAWPVRHTQATRGSRRTRGTRCHCEHVESPHVRDAGLIGMAGWDSAPVVCACQRAWKPPDTGNWRRCAQCRVSKKGRALSTMFQRISVSDEHLPPNLAASQASGSPEHAGCWTTGDPKRPGLYRAVHLLPSQGWLPCCCCCGCSCCCCCCCCCCGDGGCMPANGFAPPPKGLPPVCIIDLLSNHGWQAWSSCRHASAMVIASSSSLEFSALHRLTVCGTASGEKDHAQHSAGSFSCHPATPAGMLAKGLLPMSPMPGISGMPCG